ncbi:hypothetical protein [Veillonella sp. 3310]|uniref:hypothetical protein n=1 Tax=Veillonella sp. 3310 TaxID=2490956 RepID=UPI000FD68984|nr:hypothetical protein [Veillonella sp. 3310]
MKRDQLIKFMIAQRIKMYESIQAYGYEYRIKELQAVIEIIDGLAQLEEDDMCSVSMDDFLKWVTNNDSNNNE